MGICNSRQLLDIDELNALGQTTTTTTAATATATGPTVGGDDNDEPQSNNNTTKQQSKHRGGGGAAAAAAKLFGKPVNSSAAAAAAVSSPTSSPAGGLGGFLQSMSVLSSPGATADMTNDDFDDDDTTQYYGNTNGNSNNTNTKNDDISSSSSSSNLHENNNVATAAAAAAVALESISLASPLATVIPEEEEEEAENGEESSFQDVDIPPTRSHAAIRRRRRRLLLLGNNNKKRGGGSLSLSPLDEPGRLLPIRLKTQQLTQNSSIILQEATSPPAKGDTARSSPKSNGDVNKSKGGNKDRECSKEAVQQHTFSTFQKLKLKVQLQQRQDSRNRKVSKLEDRMQDVESYKRLWSQYQETIEQVAANNVAGGGSECSGSVMHGKSNNNNNSNDESFDLKSTDSWYFDFHSVDFDAHKNKEHNNNNNNTADGGDNDDANSQSNLSLLSEQSLEAQRRFYAGKRRKRQERMASTTMTTITTTTTTTGNNNDPPGAIATSTPRVTVDSARNSSMSPSTQRGVAAAAAVPPPPPPPTPHDYGPMSMRRPGADFHQPLVGDDTFLEDIVVTFPSSSSSSHPTGEDDSASYTGSFISDLGDDSTHGGGGSHMMMGGGDNNNNNNNNSTSNNDYRVKRRSRPSYFQHRPSSSSMDSNGSSNDYDHDAMQLRLSSLEEAVAKYQRETEEATLREEAQAELEQYNAHLQLNDLNNNNNEYGATAAAAAETTQLDQIIYNNHTTVTPMAAEKRATTRTVTPIREQLALALEKTNVQTPRAAVTDEDQSHLDAKFKRRDDDDHHPTSILEQLAAIAAENYTSPRQKSAQKNMQNGGGGQQQQRKINIHDQLAAYAKRKASQYYSSPRQGSSSSPYSLSFPNNTRQAPTILDQVEAVAAAAENSNSYSSPAAKPVRVRSIFDRVKALREATATADQPDSSPNATTTSSTTAAVAVVMVHESETDASAAAAPTTPCFVELNGHDDDTTTVKHESIHYDKTAVAVDDSNCTSSKPCYVDIMVEEKTAGDVKEVCQHDLAQDLEQGLTLDHAKDDVDSVDYLDGQLTTRSHLSYPDTDDSQISDFANLRAIAIPTLLLSKQESTPSTTASTTASQLLRLESPMLPESDLVDQPMTMILPSSLFAGTSLVARIDTSSTPPSSRPSTSPLTIEDCSYTAPSVAGSSSFSVGSKEDNTEATPNAAKKHDLLLSEGQIMVAARTDPRDPMRVSASSSLSGMPNEEQQFDDSLLPRHALGIGSIANSNEVLLASLPCLASKENPSTADFSRDESSIELSPTETTNNDEPSRMVVESVSLAVQEKKKKKEKESLQAKLDRIKQTPYNPLIASMSTTEFARLAYTFAPTPYVYGEQPSDEEDSYVQETASLYEEINGETSMEVSMDTESFSSKQWLLGSFAGDDNASQASSTFHRSVRTITDYDRSCGGRGGQEHASALLGSSVGSDDDDESHVASSVGSLGAQDKQAQVSGRLLGYFAMDDDESLHGAHGDQTRVVSCLLDSDMQSDDDNDDSHVPMTMMDGDDSHVEQDDDESEAASGLLGAFMTGDDSSTQVSGFLGALLNGGGGGEGEEQASGLLAPFQTADDDNEEQMSCLLGPVLADNVPMHHVNETTL